MSDNMTRNLFIDTLSDLVIKMKITNLADAVLKKTISFDIEESLPSYVTEEEVLDFIKTRRWYDEYLDKYVKAFDVLFNCDEYEYYEDEDECQDTIMDDVLALGTQLGKDGIILEFSEQYEKAIQDYSKIVEEKEKSELHLIEASMATKAENKLQWLLAAKGLEGKISQNGKINEQAFINLIEEAGMKVFWLDHKCVSYEPTTFETTFIVKQGDCLHCILGKQYVCDDKDNWKEELDLTTIKPLFDAVSFEKCDKTTRNIFLESLCFNWNLAWKKIDDNIYILKNGDLNKALSPYVSIPFSPNQENDVILIDTGNKYKVPHSKDWLCFSEIEQA